MSIISAVLIAVLLFMPSAGRAATVYAGIGNDGYIEDVQGLQRALSALTASAISSSHIHHDLSGSAISTSIYELQHALGPSDTLIWFYSGHSGIKSDGTDRDETSGGSFAYDAYDETIGVLSKSDKLTDDQLAETFLYLSDLAGNIVVIMDVCYAGGFIGGTLDLNRVPRLTFLGSSQEQELSYSYDDQPYSIFTTGLINGLYEFTADINRDGILMAREWFDYASDYTEESIGKQHPVFYGDNTIIARIQVPLPGASILLLSGLSMLYLIQEKKLFTR